MLEGIRISPGASFSFASTAKLHLRITQLRELADTQNHLHSGYLTLKNRCYYIILWVPPSTKKLVLLHKRLNISPKNVSKTALNDSFFNFKHFFPYFGYLWSTAGGILLILAFFWLNYFGPLSHSARWVHYSRGYTSIYSFIYMSTLLKGVHWWRRHIIWGNMVFNKFSPGIATLIF